MKLKHNRGFTYLGLLLFVALIGLVSSQAMVVLSTSQRSSEELELLYIGQQFQAALDSFYAATPAGQPHYPDQLEDLLLDPRFAETRRHLRRIYRDPITRNTEWGLVIAAEGGIRGVHSLSIEKALKQGNFPPGLEHFSGGGHHFDWVFEHVPLTPTTPQGLPPQHDWPEKSSATP